MNVRSQPAAKKLGSCEKFVAYIKQRCVKDPGCRADLRRGLGRLPSQAVSMHKMVAPWVPGDARDNDSRERAYYTVAALIAYQQRAARDADAAELADNTAPGNTETGDTATGDSSGDVLAGGRASGRNLGSALAYAVRRGGLRENAAEARLHLLVRQNTPGLHRHLPNVIRHLRADLVPVDWAQLLWDLARWDRDREQVAKHWLQSFYRDRAAAETATDAGSDTESENEMTTE